MNEIKVGNWTITPEGLNRLCGLAIIASLDRARLHRMAAECCEILGFIPESDSVARDICEEIVLHGTPVEEVIQKLQRHLEGGQ
jgi:hypothetical protein